MIIFLVTAFSGCSDPKRDQFINSLKYKITGKSNPSFTGNGKNIEVTADNITPSDCEELSIGPPLTDGLELGFETLICKNRASGERWVYTIRHDWKDTR